MATSSSPVIQRRDNESRRPKEGSPLRNRRESRLRYAFCSNVRSLAKDLGGRRRRRFQAAPRGVNCLHAGRRRVELIKHLCEERAIQAERQIARHELGKGQLVAVTRSRSERGSARRIRATAPWMGECTSIKACTRAPQRATAKPVSRRAHDLPLARSGTPLPVLSDVISKELRAEGCRIKM